jgi:hypothetical protein
MQKTAQQNEPGNRGQNDFPSNLLARITKADPPITVLGINDDGDIQFSTPMRAAGLNRVVMNRTPLARTTFFINLVGELLVRKRIDLFARMLDDMDPKTYHLKVSGHKHRNFGLIIDEQDGHDVLFFQFHSSLIQRILCEDLDKVFGA